MDIYLDANATTPVLPQALKAFSITLSDEFGNPSSTHGAGLKARAVMERTRRAARSVLGVTNGRLIFLSGATEGIHTAVLSALCALRGSEGKARSLLYGATEHRAVPAALNHWNHLLGMNLPVLAIPVGRDGRHDLTWLRDHAPHAGLVCTMAANNETGVVSDLDGIEAALAGSAALWLVDSVQALGKLPLDLASRRIDYAPFSGHKIYAPKGIGMLYVREGAPFTPLMVGGGQEGNSRSGTENMPGIAALGAVLTALEGGATFRDDATLARYRSRLAEALTHALPGLVFNSSPEVSLPTTLNFSVPGLDASSLLNLFDAADIRVSGGSACSASKALPSAVLEAMGLPAWQTASAVRLSFGPATDDDFIDEACTRIRACGDSLRRSGRATKRPGSAISWSGESDVLDEGLELDSAAVAALTQAHPDLLLVDVRETYERSLSGAPALGTSVRHQHVAYSSLLDALPAWRSLPPGAPVVFFCRSGNRSARAAMALRRLGHAQAWSIAGGRALWPGTRTTE